MSQQFLDVQFKATPKGTLTRATGSETVAIELPAEHVAGWNLRHSGRYLTDKELAIELTQGVAIAAADRFVVLSL
jgi:nitrous oxidase accessory protein NosD